MLSAITVYKFAYDLIVHASRINLTLYRLCSILRLFYDTQVGNQLAFEINEVYVIVTLVHLLDLHLLHIHPTCSNGVLDIVPVDYVVNAMLATMPRHVLRPGVSVYHVGTSTANPLSIPDFAQHMSTAFQAHPMQDRAGNIVAVDSMRVIPFKELYHLHLWTR